MTHSLPSLKDVDAFRGDKKYFGTVKNRLSSDSITIARPRFAWARFTKGGRVHAVESVVFRWNCMGGTRDKPSYTVHAACFTMSPSIQIVKDPHREDLCLRCVGRVIGNGGRR